MTDALRTAEPSGVIVGVDTHKDVHVAVAIDTLGRQLRPDQRDDVGEGPARSAGLGATAR